MRDISGWWQDKAQARLSAVIVVLWLVALPASAQQCQVPGGLVALARTLAALPEGGEGTPPPIAARLEQQLSQMSERRILKELEAQGLEGLTGIAVEVMAEGERLRRPGTRYNARQLQALLSELNNQAAVACQTSENSIYQNLQEETLGGIYFEQGFSISQLETVLEEKPAVSAVALIMLVFGLIGLLFLMDFALRWALALIYNRMICHIPAALQVHGTRIEGLVITLGRGGFRFYVIDQMAFDEKLDNDSLGAAQLDIEGEAHPCTISALTEYTADFRFEKKLALRNQRAILANSVISPYHVPKSRDGGHDASDKVIDI